MEQRYREELEEMGVKKVTALLGDYCEEQLRILTDKNVGNLRTTFNAFVTAYRGHNQDLRAVAASKAGIDETTLSAIAEAARKRRDPSTKKIVAYIQAIERFDATAKAEEANIRNPLAKNRFAQIKRRLDIAKRDGPF